MDDLLKLLDFFIRLNPNELLFQIWSDEGVQKFIIKLNTKDQLFKKGIDSTGKSLKEIGGDYSPFTKKRKSAKGQPTNRVTLKDTGKFHKSFGVIPDFSGFTILSDPIKVSDGFQTNLFDRWGGNVEGLTTENINTKLNAMVIKRFVKILEQRVAKFL